MVLDLVKVFGLVEQWRTAANEATTADAAVTYRECAEALLKVIPGQILIARCEGCGVEVAMPTKNRKKVYPDLPNGWSQSGASKHGLRGRGVRLAALGHDGSVDD